MNTDTNDTNRRTIDRACALAARVCEVRGARSPAYAGLTIDDGGAKATDGKMLVSVPLPLPNDGTDATDTLPAVAIAASDAKALISRTRKRGKGSSDSTRIEVKVPNSTNGAAGFATIATGEVVPIATERLLADLVGILRRDVDRSVSIPINVAQAAKLFATLRDILAELEGPDGPGNRPVMWMQLPRESGPIRFSGRPTEGHDSGRMKDRRVSDLEAFIMPAEPIYRRDDGQKGGEK